MFWSVTVYDIHTRSQMRIYLGDRAASSLKPSTRCPGAVGRSLQGSAHQRSGSVATRIIDLARSGFMDAKCGYDAAASVKCCGSRRRRLLPNM
jgi:hypothetical protein